MNEGIGKTPPKLDSAKAANHESTNQTEHWQRLHWRRWHSVSTGPINIGGQRLLEGGRKVQEFHFVGGRDVVHQITSCPHRLPSLTRAYRLLLPQKETATGRVAAS
jgi:hypothetical protein